MELPIRRFGRNTHATVALHLALLVGLAGAAARVPSQAAPGPRKPRGKTTTASATVSNDLASLSATLSPATLRPRDSGSLKLVLRLKPGWHVNSNKPLESYLIPTTVKVTPSAGLRAGAVRYPAGRLVKLPFSAKPLSLYENEVAWSIPLSVAANAKPGRRKVEVTVNYQACDSKTCLPPASLRIALPVPVAAAGNVKERK